MIKEIIFKKTNTLNALSGDYLTIQFDKKVNVIIGPKGGGKSTLFDLLASIQSGYISKNVIDALKDFNLEFIKAIKFSNEIINVNQLSTKTKKDMIVDFTNRNDVIFQDDPIKKNINNLEEIEKQKTEYIQNLINNSPIILGLINKIKFFYTGMEIISNLNKNNEINWSNSFQIKSKNDDKSRLIIDLSYKNDDIIFKLKIEKEYLQSIKANSEKQIREFEKMKEFNFSNVYKDKDFEKSFLEHINTLIISHKNLLILIKQKIQHINKIKLMIMSFDKSYKTVIEHIKQNDFNGEGLKAFEKQAQNYFKTLALNVVKQKKLFEELINQGIVLEFSENVVDTKLLSYKIDSNIKLNLESIIDILKVVLPTPTSVSDITKWLLELIKKGPKKFNEEKISKCIAKNIKKHVRVFAEGKDYDTMSLGQKSIYGIKYKFNRSIDQSLFLDQPEDNLDNYTIATNILNMLNKKNNQVFIVTHNANIGILSNPGKVIVADLNDDKNQYYEASIVKTNTNESKATHFLEGGIVFLEKRYMKLKGDK